MLSEVDCAAGGRVEVGPVRVAATSASQRYGLGMWMAEIIRLHFVPFNMTSGRVDCDQRVPRLVGGDVRKTLRRIYLAEVGVREKTGRNDGERVEEYLKVVGLGKGYSWCAAFVCWTLEEAGAQSPKNGWSPALFPEKKVVWRQALEGTRDTRAPASGGLRSQVPEPQSGDVFGIYYPNLKRIAHCGFVDKWGSAIAVTVEGNTGPDDTVHARDGPADGVHRKRRPIRTIYAVADWVGQ